jgi:5-methylcytosine-specific restriction enzyme subunit McrC
LDELNAKNQVSNKHLDRSKSFCLIPNLLLQFGDRKIIIDPKYKMVQDDTDVARNAFSQSDLYQIISHAMQFKVMDIKLFYPNTMTLRPIKSIKTIEVVDN